MPGIEYPYLPQGREMKYVASDHPFMVEAALAREELAGDPSFPVGIVIVKDGVGVARAGNGFSRGRQVHVGPRLVLESPTGTGYELCGLHDASGHAEQQVLEGARAAVIEPRGSDLYLFGHWWCCEPCWDAMIEAGIRDVYVVADAHERFSRELVYAQTLKPSFKTVAIEVGDGILRDELAEVVEEIGLRVVENDADVRCVMGDRGMECWPRGSKSAAYTVQGGEWMVRQVRNVLRQL